LHKISYKTTCLDAIYAEIYRTLSAPNTCARTLPVFPTRAGLPALCALSYILQCLPARLVSNLPVCRDL